MDIHLSDLAEHVVRVSEQDNRDWLAGAPVCCILARHRIVHVGRVEAVHPYHVQRPDLSGTFIMVCVGGEGRVWLAGRWQPMTSGMACLAPPHSFHAYRSIPKRRWSIAWVRYQESEGAMPIVSNRAPMLVDFDGRPLALAIEGLYREAGLAANPAAMQLWVDLIQHYAETFAEPWRTNDRLSRVWEKVLMRLSEDWTVAKLAALACMSEKQFRRLCVQSLGRSPAQQVVALRMQKAAKQLSTTSDKVEAVAFQVGYHSLFTFSRTFKKHTGYRPSEYRLMSLKTR